MTAVAKKVEVMSGVRSREHLLKKTLLRTIIELKVNIESALETKITVC